MNLLDKKAVVFYIFLSANVAELFAMSLQRYAFEVFRYDMTGFSILENEEELASGKELRAFANSLLARRVVYIDNGIKFGMAADIFFPGATEIIWSTFSPDDLFGVFLTESEEGDGTAQDPRVDWVDQVLLSLGYEIVPAAPENESEKTDETELAENEVEKKQDAASQKSRDGEKTGEKDASQKTLTQIPLPEYNFEQRTLKNADGHIRKIIYGEEIFANCAANNPGEIVIVSAVGSEFKRKTYSESYQLLKVETFKIGSTARDTYLSSKKDFFYNGNTSFAQRSVEIFYKDKTVDFLLKPKASDAEREIILLYNEKGKTTEQTKSHFEEEKKLVDEKQNWKYDSKNRVIEEKDIQYKYSKNARGRDVTEKSETRTTYEYTKKSDFPDSKFYENGILRAETAYSKANNYTQKMYFDNAMTIVLKFENGLKKSEALYSNGKLIREQAFGEKN